MKPTDKNATLPGNPETCEHPLHCLIVVDAGSRNKMDESYTKEWATMKCIACGKKIEFSNYATAYGASYYRDGEEVKIK